MMKIRLFLFSLLFSYTVQAQNTIVTDTILQLSTCAGGNIIVPFTATGTYPPGNVFTAQLSDLFGQFTAPINIGSVPFNIGLIFATIPASTNFGFLYKIRVISSSPAIIGTPCPNTLIITQVAQLNQIIASPNDTACVGDEVTLTALNPAGSYAWSTGDTTQSITVNQAGNYSVTVTDFLMCESDTSIEIVMMPAPCTAGVEETVVAEISLAPNPTSGKFILNFANTVPKNDDILLINNLGQQQFVPLHSLGNHQLEMDLSALANGVYFVKIQTENEHLALRVVKE